MFSSYSIAEPMPEQETRYEIQFRNRKGTLYGDWTPEYDESIPSEADALTTLQGLRARSPLWEFRCVEVVTVTTRTVCPWSVEAQEEEENPRIG